MQDLTIRLAGATPDNQPIKSYDEKFEIVSLGGILTADNCHLHIAVSDVRGNVQGGHLKHAKVGVTAEVVLGEDKSVVYARVMDKATGLKELEVKAK